MEGASPRSCGGLFVFHHTNAYMWWIILLNIIGYHTGRYGLRGFRNVRTPRNYSCLFLALLGFSTHISSFILAWSIVGLGFFIMLFSVESFIFTVGFIVAKNKLRKSGKPLTASNLDFVLEREELQKQMAPAFRRCEDLKVIARDKSLPSELKVGMYWTLVRAGKIPVEDQIPEDKVDMYFGVQ